MARDFLSGLLTSLRESFGPLSLRIWPLDLEYTLSLQLDYLIVDTSVGLDQIPKSMRERLLFVFGPKEAEDPSRWIQEDGVEIGRVAARHFLKNGYRHGATVLPCKQITCRLRKTGFEKELEQAGVLNHHFEESDRIIGYRYTQEFEQQLETWLSSLPDSTGIFVWDDWHAMPILEACRRLGRKVPGELGVLGTGNDTYLSGSSYPVLDSMHMPFQMMGEAAANWIMAMERGEHPALPPAFPPLGIMRRKSTSIQSSDDPEIQRVFECLYSLPLHELSVHKLGEGSGVSRRTLARRFQKELGKSMHDVLEQRRLAVAEYLLTNTERTTFDIAQECGFQTARSLELMFRKHHGESPGAYAKHLRRESLF